MKKKPSKTGVGSSNSGVYRINSVEFKHRGEDYIAPLHIRNDFQFYLNLRTPIEVCIQGEWSKMEAGEFVLLPPGEARSYRGTGGEPEYLLIHFEYEGELVEKLIGGQRALPVSIQELSQRLVEELLNPRDGAEQMIDALGVQLLIELVRCAHVVTKKKAAEDERVRVLEQYMKTDFHRSLGREDFSRAVSLSPSHVGHFFQKKTGKTLISRLTEIRIDEAKKLLAQTNLPLTFIALEVGFNSYSHFTQLFQRYLGCSPSKYRGQLQ